MECVLLRNGSFYQLGACSCTFLPISLPQQSMLKLEGWPGSWAGTSPAGSFRVRQSSRQSEGAAGEGQVETSTTLEAWPTGQPSGPPSLDFSQVHWAQSSSGRLFSTCKICRICGAIFLPTSMQFANVFVRVLSHFDRVRLWQPCGLKPSRFLCPWDSPCKNTRVGCHAPLQGIFSTHESNPCLLRLLGRQVLYY